MIRLGSLSQVLSLALVDERCDLIFVFTFRIL
jgi:hypothetical protein